MSAENIFLLKKTPQFMNALLIAIHIPTPVWIVPNSVIHYCDIKIN